MSERWVKAAKAADGLPIWINMARITMMQRTGTETHLYGGTSAVAIGPMGDDVYDEWEVVCREKPEHFLPENGHD